MLTKLKKKVEKTLAIEAKIALKIGFTPNRVSILGIFFAFLSSMFYSSWKSDQSYLLFASVALLLSGFCDSLDGTMARLHGRTTVFGGFLDSVLDRYADGIVIAGIIIGGLCELFWGLAALLGSLLVSYVRAKSEANNVMMESIGVAERAERLVIILASGTIAYLWNVNALINIGMILIAILANVTVLQRGLHFYKKTKKKD